MTKKVIIGLSGGIDSSVAAMLLVEQGYEVIGVTLKIWEDGDYTDGEWHERSCCKTGLAKFIADQLKIPYCIYDVHKEFRELVIANFCDEYMKGRTPNPCIICNERIKFSLLLKKAKELGADYIATGHYARVDRDLLNEKYELKQGIDQSKDQSYFLYRLSQGELSRILFPLGEYTKDRVYRMAESLDIPVEMIKESQEVCFVNREGYYELIARRIPASVRHGKFVSTSGEILGEHKGIAFYTVGQRRGLGISTGERLYVIRIDRERNEVVLGRKEELYSSGFIAEDVHMVNGEAIEDMERLQVKIRYRHVATDGLIMPLKNKKVKVVFDIPQQAVTPGQASVFYDGDVVRGGGVIESSF